MRLLRPGVMIPSLNKVRRDRIFNMAFIGILLRFRDFLTLHDIQSANATLRSPLQPTRYELSAIVVHWLQLSRFVILWISTPTGSFS